MSYEVIKAVLVTAAVSFLTVDGANPTRCPSNIIEAQCNLQNNLTLKGVSYQIRGSVSFKQNVTSDCQRRMGLVEINTKITGLPTDDGTEYHAIHVHESNDLSNGCDSMGPHFNPLNTSHGARRDTLEMRHIGDFGNVGKFFNLDLGAYLSDFRTDPLLNLVGNHSIIGRSLVLRANKDDGGLGGDAQSLIDGNSGPALACCVIERTQSSRTNK